jgi:hypothetical protein
MDREQAEQRIKEVWKAAGQSVATVARLSTVPILRGTADDGELAGTGVLLQVADQPFVVTAGHVAWDGTQGRESLAIGTREGNVNLSEAKVVHTTPAVDRHSEDAVDVALVLLTEEHRAQLLDAGHSFARNDVVARHYEGSPPFHHFLWLYGFPSERRIKDVDAKILDVRAVVQSMGMTSGVGKVSRFDPKRMIAASYPDPSADGSGTPDPDGMSGGGVWATVQGDSEVPTCDHVRIVGIQTALNRPTLIARSTRMSVVYSMIVERFPELKAALGLVTGAEDIYPHVDQLGLAEFVVPVQRRS